MLTIWGRKTSSNVQAVMWCVGELGIAHERIDAGHVHGVVDTPAYKAMNPMGLVPTIKDGEDPPIFESGAILRYLAARYGPDAFWPADAAARAQVDLWAEWAKINVTLAFTGPIFWRVVRTPPSKQDWDAIRKAVAKHAKLLDVAEARLAENPFLAGDAFTLADIQFAHCLYRYYDIAVERPEHPNVRRYYEAMAERPAYREHVMVSYEPLRETD